MDKVTSYFKSKLALVAKIMKFEFEMIENFYDVVRPFYYVAKLFGYSPFTLPKDTSLAHTAHQATLLDLIISILCFSLYFILLYIQLSMEKLYSQGILVIDIAEDVLLAYLTCTSILSTSILLLLRKHVWTLINDIASIDNKVSLCEIVTDNLNVSIINSDSSPGHHYSPQTAFQIRSRAHFIVFDNSDRSYGLHLRLPTKTL